MTLLLGLDIGTTSTIGILIDTVGGIRATASRPSELISKHPNWAEEDPALWWANTMASPGGATSRPVGGGKGGRFATCTTWSSRPLLCLARAE